MRTWTWMAALALLGGCATTLTARLDYDRAQDFSGYRSYAWIADDPIVTAPGEAPRVSPLNRRRIVAAVEAALARKGYTVAADPAAADFVVAYTVGQRDRITVDAWPAPYRSWGRWRWPYAGRDIDVRSYTEGTLAIDIFDGRTRAPVWHGWTRKQITEADIEQAAARIPEAVDVIIAQFPPR
jgi:hypothetical protein